MIKVININYLDHSTIHMNDSTTLYPINVSNYYVLEEKQIEPSIRSWKHRQPLRSRLHLLCLSGDGSRGHRVNGMAADKN